MQPPREQPSSGRRTYEEPRVIKDRDDIYKVSAFERGIKGQQQKRRRPFY
jgi:hypothetical protein